MDKWKKIKLLEKSNYSSFYDEKYGLVKDIYFDVALVDDKGQRYPIVYSLIDPNSGKLGTTLCRVVDYDISTIFDIDFYLQDNKTTTRNTYYYGGTPQSIAMDNAKKITKPRYYIDIRYSLMGIDSNNNYSTSEKRLEPVIVKSKAEFEKISIWATKTNIQTYQMPILMDLEVGQKYFYIGKGVCEVAKVYEYPQRASSAICKVAFVNGATEVVGIGDRRFVHLPFDAINELTQFNDSLNELFLQPVVTKNQEHNLINVIWQPIEEASQYIVKLYRYVNTNNRRKVYFLKDYVVDRNEQFLSMSNLILDGHIIVVLAENRSGEIIAQSRGIDIASSNGEPKFW